MLDRIAKSGRYDRIVVVGHSLGSVIGYDMLHFAWQRHVDAHRGQISAEWKSGRFPNIEKKEVRAAEQLAKTIRDNEAATRAELDSFWEQWQLAAWRVAEEMKRNDNNWLVTDFVTLGSPLTYGDLLLASNRQNFARRARERELPHCPPVRELNGRFSFEHKDRDDQDRPQHAWILNQASVFAATAWTNLYFPSWLLFGGDIIGGPIAPLFWAGVHDVEVQTKCWGGWLAHTRYWRRDARDVGSPGNPVVKLREALDLKRERHSADRPPPA